MKYPLLSTKQPHADLLVTPRVEMIETSTDHTYAVKGIECRGITTTKINQRIGIYATNSKLTQAEIDDMNCMIAGLFRSHEICYPNAMLISYAINNRNPVRGAIIGTVEISLAGIATRGDIELDQHVHLNPYNWFTPNIKTYFWHMRNPIKFEKPIPFKAKSITWNYGGDEIDKLIYEREQEVINDV